MQPAFLAWFATRCASDGYTPDLVLAAPTGGATPEVELVARADLETHPRVLLAHVFRTGVRVFSDAEGRGLVTLGTGPAGRREVSVEIAPGHRDRGLGRRLARTALTLAEDGVLFAQVSPGNVASLRAFLAAGYTPICSEVWFRTRPAKG